jgi:ribosome-associated toxin RatA of RatAB toxin-antitoxin module
MRCAQRAWTKTLQRFASSAARRTHEERRLLKYSNVQLYNVVADVSKYREFVPWCRDSVVTRSDANAVSADLTVGFDVFTEKYTSHVQLQPYSSIIATSKDTKLLEHLHTEWKFAPSASNPLSSCWVTFRVEFQFKSSLYSHISDLFMREVTNNMVKAFEGRCRAVYG